MKFLSYVIVLTNILLLQGCSAVNQQEFFAAHEKSFKAQTNYITHHIQRNKFKIHAREFGKKTQKPTLILMHGFPDSMHLYDWLIPEISEDQHIITFDFLGWGDSDKPKRHLYDFSSLQQDLNTVIDYFNLESVVLVLHDASGIPGIDWALVHPKQTAGLVLLNTFYNPMPTLQAPEEIDLFSTHGIRRTISIWATSLSSALWIKHFNEQTVIPIDFSAPQAPERLFKQLDNEDIKVDILPTKVVKLASNQLRQPRIFSWTG